MYKSANTQHRLVDRRLCQQSGDAWQFWPYYPSFELPVSQHQSMRWRHWSYRWDLYHDMTFYTDFCIHCQIKVGFKFTHLPLSSLLFSASRKLFNCPVGLGCRIHRLHLSRGVSPPPHQWVSLIWHKTIWWWGSSNAAALGNAKYPFIAIASSSNVARRGSTWKGLIYGLNRTNSKLMLNWIVLRNWIV